MMSPFEIIGRLCEVIEDLTEIVEDQQNIIEQSKVEEVIKDDLRVKIAKDSNMLDQIGHDYRSLGKE